MSVMSLLQMKSTYFWSLTFGESLKSENA